MLGVDFWVMTSISRSVSGWKLGQWWMKTRCLIQRVWCFNFFYFELKVFRKLFECVYCRISKVIFYCFYWIFSTRQNVHQHAWDVCLVFCFVPKIGRLNLGISGKLFGYISFYWKGGKENGYNRRLDILRSKRYSVIFNNYSLLLLKTCLVMSIILIRDWVKVS